MVTLAMKYRSRDAILKCILEEIEKKNGHARITEIMYKSFLSHYQLKKYMQSLKKSGLIVEKLVTEKQYEYKLTDKGRKLLGIYNEMDKMVPDISDPE
jgi:predicted transcriptional regulator